MTLVYFNAMLAFSTFLLAVGSIARMNGSTSNAVRASILLILVGSLGETFTRFVPDQWGPYVHSLFLAGVLAFLISNFRAPAWIEERWRTKLAFIVLSAMGLAIILHLVIDLG